MWLLHQLVRTYRPTHWQPGERQYWKGWFKTWVEGTEGRYSLLRNKARCFRSAVDVLQIIVESRLDYLDEPPDAGKAAATAASIRPNQEAIELALNRLDRVLSRPSWLPRRRHWTTSPSAPTANGRYRRGIRRSAGWLARWNAACLHSLLINLPHELRPKEHGRQAGTASSGAWPDAQARHALQELALVLRDPHAQLPPSWVRTDPDLENLREHSRHHPDEDLRRWWEFIGLKPSRAALPATTTGPPPAIAAGDVEIAAQTAAGDVASSGIGHDLPA